jgi:hypothetical protein
VQKQNFSGKRRSDGADPQTAGTKLLGQHTPDPEKTHQKFTTTLSSDVGHTDTNTNPHLFHHLIHDGLKTQKVITDRADPQTLGTNILGLHGPDPNFSDLMSCAMVQKFRLLHGIVKSMKV